MNTFQIVFVTILVFLQSTAKAGNFYTSASNKLYYVESAYNVSFNNYIKIYFKKIAIILNKFPVQMVRGPYRVS